jgi:hypothetical protein
MPPLLSIPDQLQRIDRLSWSLSRARLAALILDIGRGGAPISMMKSGAHRM